MDTTTSLSDGQLVFVVLWNVTFLLPLLGLAGAWFRGGSRAAGAVLAGYALLLLALPAWLAASVDYADGSEPLFELVAVYLIAWIVVAVLGGLLLAPLAYAVRQRPRRAGPETGNRQPPTIHPL